MQGFIIKAVEIRDVDFQKEWRKSLDISITMELAFSGDGSMFINEDDSVRQDIISAYLINSVIKADKET